MMIIKNQSANNLNNADFFVQTNITLILICLFESELEILLLLKNKSKTMNSFINLELKIIFYFHMEKNQEVGFDLSSDISLMF